MHFDTDFLIIGSGPAGIAVAGATQPAGFRTVLVDKGVLADAITKASAAPAAQSASAH